MQELGVIAANYGGGTNSTALLIDRVLHGVVPDYVLFADTGSERPATYAYVPRFSQWLVDHGAPPVTTVRWIRVMAPHKGEFIALHDWCEASAQVPSKAFGLSGCTTKWKQQVIDGWLKRRDDVRVEWAAGRAVERWIGYDADEPERAERMFAKNPDPHLWAWRAPLVEDDIGREECVEIIRATGLPLPGKSACWMCPSMTAPEILALGREHPELLARALRMESAAIAAGNLGGKGKGKRVGLGGRLNWRKLIEEGVIEKPSEDVACGCYDGEG